MATLLAAPVSAGTVNITGLANALDFAGEFEAASGLSDQGINSEPQMGRGKWRRTANGEYKKFRMY